MRKKWKEYVLAYVRKVPGKSRFARFEEDVKKDSITTVIESINVRTNTECDLKEIITF